MKKRIWLGVAVTVSTLTATVVLDFLYLAIGRAAKQVTPHSLNDFGQKVTLFPPVSFDVAGVSTPLLLCAQGCGLHDDDIVIGVSAFGESRAYLQSAFDNAAQLHIVNDVMASIPVTITHCDRTRCTRVLSSGKVNEPVSIRCGGWLAVQEMALLIGEQKYAQSSPEIPLVDLPFVVSTWKEWRKEHPNSKVYLGGAAKAGSVPQNMPEIEFN